MAADAGVLHHLALAADWAAARAAGREYRVSTVGASLEEVGFIHLCFPDQVELTAARFYAGRADVLLLTIDPGRLAAEVRVEQVGRAGRFPHLYGPLPLEAVVDVAPWPPPDADSVDHVEDDR